MEFATIKLDLVPAIAALKGRCVRRRSALITAQAMVNVPFQESAYATSTTSDKTAPSKSARMIVISVETVSKVNAFAYLDLPVKVVRSELNHIPQSSALLNA